MSDDARSGWEEFDKNLEEIRQITQRIRSAGVRRWADAWDDDEIDWDAWAAMEVES